jgi:Na+/H+ antiporter NhaD/arsenite permease-like protein
VTIFFYRFTPTLSRESVCGQLLIRIILVLLFSFEVPLKKNNKKKVAAKKKQKQTKKATTKKALCVCFLFLCAVVLCDYLCVQARVSSIV